MAIELRNRSKSEIIFWVGLLGGVASILSFIGSFFVPTEWWFRYIAVSSSIYIVILLLICAYAIWDRGRTIAEQARQNASNVARIEGERSLLEKERDEATRYARYIEAFPRLHGIYHPLRDALVAMQRHPPEPDDVFDMDLCRKILDVFRDIFNVVKEQEFSTCIKNFCDQSVLQTICRDSVNEAKRGNDDDTRRSPVNDNTDFMQLMHGTKPYFFCNDLVERSRAGQYDNDNPHWADHYRSTIVWPIRCKTFGQEKFELFGFLCVDSMATDVFNEETDVELGACVADMIYAYFNRIDTIHHD